MPHHILSLSMPKLQPTAEELGKQQLQLHLPATRGSRQPRVFTLG